MSILVTLLAGAAVPAFVIAVCTLIEQMAVIERYSLKSRLPGLAMNIVQEPLSALLAWPIHQFWQFLGIGKVATIPLWTWLAPLGSLGSMLQFLVLVLLIDFLIYWRHRTEHKLFWPIHAVHHSPTEL